MTDENRVANLRDELARAQTALKAADLLADQHLANDAISRLYYYLFYHVRALLLTKGLESRSHGGMLRLFSLHFVKSGVFPARSAHLLSKLMKYREEADYDTAHEFTDDDFAELRAEASALASAIQEHIAEAGYR